MTYRPTFILGLPTPADNELFRAAVNLEAAVMLSANAFARRPTVASNGEWGGFSLRHLPHLTEVPARYLDSAGFVAASRYRGFPWTVGEYIDLAAANDWTGFFSMDWCVEREIAPNRTEVLNRISGTVRLNMECAIAADRSGIIDRLIPVIQGWEPGDYLRCMDKLALANDLKLIGVGSMCRRHVSGPCGVLEVVDAIDNALSNKPTRLHLFGVKTEAMGALRNHPRVASFDSQAYGLDIRMKAITADQRPDFFESESGRPSKNNATVARSMDRWYRKQIARLSMPGGRSISSTKGIQFPATKLSRLDGLYERTRETLRELHEDGEIEWTDLNELVTQCCAADEEDDE